MWWQKPKHSFLEIISSPIKNIYWLFSDYPDWVGRTIVGTLFGIFIGLVLRRFGKHILYIITTASLTIWLLWYAKIIVIKPAALQAFFGCKVCDTKEIMLLVKIFFFEFKTECITACIVGFFSFRSRMAQKIHA